MNVHFYYFTLVPRLVAAPIIFFRKIPCRCVCVFGGWRGSVDRGHAVMREQRRIDEGVVRIERIQRRPLMQIAGGMLERFGVGNAGPKEIA